MNDVQWESLEIDWGGGSNPAATLQRTLVPNGWLYKSTAVVLIGGMQKLLSTSITFVPDDSAKHSIPETEGT